MNVRIPASKLIGFLGLGDFIPGRGCQREVGDFPSARAIHEFRASPAVVYFASDDSKWVNGETLYIAGGYR
jgi:hypothetical protein